MEPKQPSGSTSPNATALPDVPQALKRAELERPHVIVRDDSTAEELSRRHDLGLRTHSGLVAPSYLEDFARAKQITGVPEGIVLPPAEVSAIRKLFGQIRSRMAAAGKLGKRFIEKVEIIELVLALTMGAVYLTVSGADELAHLAADGAITDARAASWEKWAGAPYIVDAFGTGLSAKVTRAFEAVHNLGPSRVNTQRIVQLRGERENLRDVLRELDARRLHSARPASRRAYLTSPERQELVKMIADKTAELDSLLHGIDSTMTHVESGERPQPQSIRPALP